MNTPPDSATGDAPTVPGAASKSSTGAAPASAAPDPLNPTPAQLFDALQQTGVEYIIVHCWCRQFELRFMAGGSYVTNQWSEVLRFIGLYQPVEEESEKP